MKSLQSYARAMSYFRADVPLIVLLVTLIAMSVGLGLLQAWPVAVLVDSVLTQTPKNDWAHRLFLAPLPNDRLFQVIGITLIGMLIKIFQDTIWMLRMMLNNRIRYSGTARARHELFAKLQALPLSFHKSRPQGDAIYRVSNDCAGPFGVLDTFLGAATAAVTLTSMTLILFFRNAPLTFFALSITPLLILANRHFGRRIKMRSAESKQADANLTTSIQRAMSSVSLIQAFGRERHEQGRFGQSVEHSVARGMSLNWQENLYPLTVQIIFAIGGAIIFGYGGYLVYRDQFLNPVANGTSVGDLLVFMAYLGQLWDPLGLVLGFTAKVQTHAAASERVFEVLDRPVEISDSPDAQPLPPRPRALQLRHVGFDYSGTTILNDVSCCISAGEMVAFVGRSGTGKSTLLNLLPRFYDPSRGSLRLDGIDLRDIKLADIRKHIAVVSQENGLHVGTIAENIAYGNPAATPLEIRAAAQMADAAEFIEALPEAYDTQIVDGGQNLSGGQRQRLAIARALATHAPFLVLDEPTSALDPHAEKQVMKTIEALRGKRTVILVTHRLSSIAACDQIFVMDQGRIAEHGTHSQLLNTGGLYAKMLRLQMAEENSVTVDDGKSALETA
jgi:ATP-binding cassette, subfamily B, bacterial